MDPEDSYVVNLILQYLYLPRLVREITELVLIIQFLLFSQHDEHNQQHLLGDCTRTNKES